MQVGSYVICIDDSNWSKSASIKMNKLPKKNQVYRIRRVIEGFKYQEGDDGIALVGIYGDWDNFINDNNQIVFEEYHFRKNRFKEIEEIQTTVLLEETEAILVA